MSRCVRKTLSGWGGIPCAETDVFRPESLEEARAVLTSKDAIIPRGLGRAYGDAAFLGNGATLLTERLDRFLGVDVEAGILECEAGLDLETVIAHLLPRGLFPKVVPGTQGVTMGGLVACDVHGKNHHRDGSTSRHLHSMDLILADGTRTRVSRKEDPELFWATVGGMGLTGMIERVRFGLERVPSGYFSVDVDRVDNYEEALALFHGSDDAYAYSVAWIDCVAKGKNLGRAVLLRGNWLDPSELDAKRAKNPHTIRRRPRIGVPFQGPPGLLNPLSVRAFNTGYFHKTPRKARGEITTFEPFFFPLDVIRDWNRLYGPRGFLQYQFLVPEDGGSEALRAVLEVLSSSGAASFLAVLKRFGAGEPDAPLSFPERGYTLALDLPSRGQQTLDLLEELDALVLAAGGRVYLAKDSRMSATTFRAMYPRYEAWRAVKERVDPEERFRSDLSVRLEITR